LNAYIADVPAGCEADPHRHAYPTVVYVLEGAFQLQEGEHGEKVTDYKAGEAFSEPAGEVVAGRALVPTKLLVVVLREPGKPEARPA
jgi:quercetin dioxygenase-like cupin family protein